MTPSTALGMERLTPKGRRAIRIVFVTVFIAIAFWGAQALPRVLRVEAVRPLSLRLLHGEEVKPDSVARAAAYVDTLAHDTACWPDALEAPVILNLSLANKPPGQGGEAEARGAMEKLRDSAVGYLRCHPQDGFVWLVLYWAESEMQGVTPRTLALLEASHRFAPLEGWIMLLRSRLALPNFAKLTPVLQQKSLREFAAFVRDGYLREAAEILAGPGWGVRDQLLEALRELPNDRKLGLAYSLNRLGAKAEIPGIEKPEARPWR